MKKDINYYKNKSIFITATNTDVGKTYASEKFLRFFAKNGLIEIANNFFQLVFDP